MKQLLILSGKGGSGKTTIASAFIRLSEAKAFADCDVDAPNLHLCMEQTMLPLKAEYYGMPKAVIDAQMCVSCGYCSDNCRFNAINGCMVDPYVCEGCGVCEALCPAHAISLKPAAAGELMLYADENSVFSTARLKTGSGNSGKLVTEVKRQMKSALLPETELAVIDGSPGIGCPVIASLSGVNMALIVTEPSISGISDMERILKTADIFRTKICVCINKYDTNLENTKRIEEFCGEMKIPLTGRLPFDLEAVKAINRGLTIADVDCPSGVAVKKVYDSTMKQLFDL